MLNSCVEKIQAGNLLAPVVVAADDAYLYPLLIAVLSAHEKSVQKIDFIVAYDKKLLSPKSLTVIHDVLNHFEVSVSFLEIDISDSKWDKSFNIFGHFGRMCYIKLLLPEYVDSNFLWLDSDTLTRLPLDDLLTRENQSQSWIVSAVLEDHSKHKWKTTNKAIRKVGKNYFNAGIMLINSSGWKISGIDQRWREIILKYQRYGFEWGDQDVLNYVFLRRTGFVPLSENYNTGIDKEIIQSETRILHFKASSKPWHLKFSDFEVESPHYKEYLQFELKFLSMLKSEDNLKREIEEIRKNLVREKQPPQTVVRSYRSRSISKVKFGLLFLRQLIREIEIVGRN